MAFFYDLKKYPQNIVGHEYLFEFTSSSADNKSRLKEGWAEHPYKITILRFSCNFIPIFASYFK